MPSFAPFNSFVGMSQCQGASMMALQNIFKKLNVDVELINYPYARILHSIKSAQFDIALIFKNNSIEEYVDYIGPVSHSEIIIISQKNKPIKKYQDLTSLNNIAVIRNAQFEAKFDNDQALNKISVDSYQQAINMFKHKRVDAVIGSKVGLDYAFQQSNINKSLLNHAYQLGHKEWGLHLSKKSQFQQIKPLLVKAVKDVYQIDLIHRLYQKQLKHCVNSTKV